MRQKPGISLQFIYIAMLFGILPKPIPAKQPGFISGNKAAAPLRVWVAPTINTNDNKFLSYDLREKLLSTLAGFSNIQLIEDSSASSKTLEYYGNETSVCLDISCIVEVGRQVQAQRILFSEVTPQRKNWKVEFRWLESPSGNLVRHKSQVIDFNNPSLAEQPLNQMMAHVVGKKKMSAPGREKTGTFIVRRKMENPKGPPKELTEKTGSSTWIWLTGGTSALAGAALAAWYFIPRETTPTKVNMSREVVLE